MGWDGRTPEDHPHFGMNLLQRSEDRRCPRTGKSLGPVPEWYRRLRSFHVPGWPEVPEKPFWWRQFTADQWLERTRETYEEWEAKRAEAAWRIR